VILKQTAALLVNLFWLRSRFKSVTFLRESQLEATISLGASSKEARQMTESGLGIARRVLLLDCCHKSLGSRQ